MPRLFTALKVPSKVVDHLCLLQSGLPGARWIDRENFHITLRFVGDIERPLALELAQSLEEVQAAPFNLQLDTLDAFGNSKPHSLFAAVKRSDELMALRSEQDRICRRLRIDPDPRKYIPHLTLARVRGVSVSAIAGYLSNNGGFQSTPFEVDRFVLLSSRESVGGGPYVEEEVYRLTEKTHAKA